MGDELNKTSTGVKDLLEAGTSMAAITKEEDLLYAVVPDGYSLKIEDISDLKEATEEKPRRITGLVGLRTSDSFCNFIEREHVEQTTVCFADVEQATFKAVFNYCGPGGVPGWCDRKAQLELMHTREWLRWVGNDRKDLSQLELADFFDANLDDIVEPDGAEIVEMITALKVKRKVSFHSAVDQNTGFTTVQFTENTSGEAVKGSIDFFGKFTIGIAPFRGSDPYKIKCMLRFTINNENQLKVFYGMINRDVVEEAAFGVEQAKIMERMQGLGVPVFDI